MFKVSAAYVCSRGGHLQSPVMLTNLGPANCLWRSPQQRCHPRGHLDAPLSSCARAACYTAAHWKTGGSGTSPGHHCRAPTAQSHQESCPCTAHAMKTLQRLKSNSLARRSQGQQDAKLRAQRAVLHLCFKGAGLCKCQA